MKVSPALRIRTVSAALALVAGAGLLACQPATPPANAATADDLSDSARTYAWSEGIVGADDSIVAPRDPDHPMYEDFADLEVTVSQTEDVRAQSVQVTWSGGVPTVITSGGNQPAAGYLQLMQCWGDENAGPDPETCVWGADGLPGTASMPGDTGLRSLATAPADPLLDEDTLAGYLDPTINRHRVPFLAASADEPVWDPVSYYDRWTTNEFRLGMTRADGTGERHFTLQDGTEASHLGCGRTLEDGEVRDCWLVVVPRGTHEVDGFAVTDDPTGTSMLRTSPLSPTNWAQRIQVRLDFAPIGLFCPIEAAQRPTIGSDFMGAAMYSWQRALCADDGAVYGFTPAGDSTARETVAGGLPGNPGLGFTSAPVTESDGPAPVVHAPVAISGLAIGFNLVAPDGERIDELRLTPLLVAKLLTQTYWRDLPGLPAPPPAGQPDERPEWIRANPETVLDDPGFQQLNPDVDPGVFRLHASNLLKVPVEPSDAVRDLWRWIFHDEEAAAWLRGEPDENGIRVNPVLGEVLTGHLEAGTAPDFVPRDVEYCFEVLSEEDESARRPRYCSLDLLPYTNGFEDGARRNSIFETNFWAYDPNAVPPSGQGRGWYSRPEPRPSGAALTITDSVSAAQYGIGTAALLNAAGEFVAPTEAGIAAGVEAMLPGDEIESVLQVDPEAADPAAYPLPAVTYAAVRVEQEDEALADYSTFLEHAAGAGQTPGWSPGELPEGYLPLPEYMREQTLAVAAQLVQEDPVEKPPGLTPGGRGEDGEDPPPGGDASGGPGSDPAGNGAPGSGDAPDPASLSPAGDDPTGGTAPPAPGGGTENPAPPSGDDDVLVAQSTPGEPVGPMQYALLVVLIVGLAGALAGPALLRLGPRAPAG
ncbi:hypothetical protein [Jiangella anatolica]|uniref:PBP domain-containing protein n=1 Tax=Jiangella anatolica TaxID=2670374 RepID=A0A2W2BYS2_9ACTN|nr:hypothetical protein [Jiangella anatolica]PZF80767.1 hypothetical protein C1I92_24310 [Jiangella anatolica]